MVATFEMPTEIEKQDVHISFQRGRLVVTWVTVEVIEYEEDEGTVYRERFERSHHRTIPLPEGTKVRYSKISSLPLFSQIRQFEEVQAIMNGRRLSLRYPNMRCLRVEPQSRSGNSWIFGLNLLYMYNSSLMDHLAQSHLPHNSEWQEKARDSFWKYGEQTPRCILLEACGIDFC